MVAREILSPLVSRFENSSPYFAPILSPLYPRKELAVLLYPPLLLKDPTPQELSAQLARKREGVSFLITRPLELENEVSKGPCLL